MGAEGKRKLRLRNKTNGELFSLYQSQLVLKHRSRDALEEAKRVVGHFRAFLGEYPPSPELAAAFLAQFSHLKPASLYRYHAIIKGFMSWYGEPLDTRIRVPQTLPDYTEPEEIEKLREALSNKRTHKKVVARNLLLVHMGIKAGLRRGELANLKVGDINLEREYVVVRQGKGMKDRIVDLAPSLTQELRVYLEGKNPKDMVFGLTPGAISDLIRRAAKKAGLSLHAHSLRDFFGQSLVDAGVDLEIVRRLLGHTNLNVTQRYVARTDKQRKQAIDKLEAAKTSGEAPGLQAEQQNVVSDAGVEAQDAQPLPKGTTTTRDSDPWTAALQVMLDPAHAIPALKRENVEEVQLSGLPLMDSAVVKQLLGPSRKAA